MAPSSPKRLIAVGVVICALAAPAGALAAEAPCEGDECQGPPPAPEEIVPATSVVSGPENPPVRFEAAHHPKKPHKGHKGKRGKAKAEGHRGKKRSAR